MSKKNGEKLLGYISEHFPRDGELIVTKCDVKYNSESILVEDVPVAFDRVIPVQIGKTVINAGLHKSEGGKNMTGIELYEMYYSEMRNQGIGMDGWDELEPSDRDAWDAVAEQVQLKPEKKT